MSYLSLVSIFASMVNPMQQMMAKKRVMMSPTHSPMLIISPQYQSGPNTGELSWKT